VHYNIVSASAELTQSSWRDAGSAAELTLRADAEPLHGIRVFGETTSSDRGASYFAGLPGDSIYTITKYSGMRAGAEVTWRGSTAGVAGLKVKSDSVIPFGLPFDRRYAAFFGGDVTGVEVNGRVPLPLIKGIAAIGHLTNWQSGTIPLYLPTRMYRAGLELHTSPLKSDNLEILGRIEAIHRGPMLVINPDTTADEGLLTQPQNNSIDAYLQIRIMDIRAFIRVEDFQGQILEVIPNRVLRGARMIYGLKWQFYN
jgi:hypothetical protein